MHRFLFRFGYCTPTQWRANSIHGWDDECSGAFFIRAANVEDALTWGCEVAELFVRGEFEKADFEEIPSWKNSKFAFWIDENPSEAFSPVDLEKLPEVTYKQTPSFQGWV